MYMVKAQKKLADLEKKEKEERRIEELGGLKIVKGAVSPDIPTDGPKGAKKKVKYIGSFKVFPPPGLSGQALFSAVADFVGQKAGDINPKRVSNPISGTLMVNRYGIRFYKDKSVFMSYPIKKITYCTAIPRMATFAMVTRSIQQQPEDVTYCHMFAVPNAEQASELSQYMSQAFKLAVAQTTLRRSLKSKDSKDKKKSKTPWEVLKRKEDKSSQEKASPASSKRGKSPTPPPRETKDSKSKNRVSSCYLNPPPPTAPGFSPVTDRRIASSDITVDGLKAEIMYLEQQIATTESQLQSMSPASDAALELTIQLSADEDKLHVKKHQLYNLEQMAMLTPPSAPVYQPPQPQQPQHSPRSDHLLPPSYDAMYGGGIGGGAIGGSDEFDETSMLEDADWYQAGLPREVVMDILAFQPQGSFIVRDSSSNPGCHALSIKAPDGSILHYLIAKDGQGYFIQGNNTRHPSLLSLITHHASVLEFLPTVLSLGSANPLAQSRPPPVQMDMGHGAADGQVMYPWLPDSDDSDIDDEEMVHRLETLQLLNP